MKRLFIVLLCTASVASIVWCAFDYGTTKSLLTACEDENLSVEESSATVISMHEADSLQCTTSSDEMHPDTVPDSLKNSIVRDSENGL